MSVRFADDDVCLMQGQFAENYDTMQQNIALNIKNIYTDNELTNKASHKKYLLPRQEGNRNVQRNIECYNLDIINTMFVDYVSHILRYGTERLHYAVHEHVDAEIIYGRVDSENSFVGMTNFKGN